MSTSLTLSKREGPRKGIGRILLLVTVWAGLYSINERIWDWLLFSLIGLDQSSKVGDTLHFLFYDLIKISLLLIGITSIVTFVQSYITLEGTQRLLGGKRQGWGHAVAAVLGTVTPFCSCSSVPVFIGFVGSRIPIGITMTFLIASPLVSEVAFFLLFALFGWKIAFLYAASGIVISIVAGVVLGAIKAERWVEPFVFETRAQAPAFGAPRYSLKERTMLGLEEAKSIYLKLWPYLVVGIGIGALIHGWIPTSFFSQYLGAENPFAVLVAVLIGIPLYSNATGVMPIFQALYDKGVPVGTLLAFMMAVIALSLPEIILLRKVLNPKLLGIFAVVVASGIIFVGYLFNAII